MGNILEKIYQKCLNNKTTQKTNTFQQIDISEIQDDVHDEEISLSKQEKHESRLVLRNVFTVLLRRPLNEWFVEIKAEFQNEQDETITDTMRLGYNSKGEAEKFAGKWCSDLKILGTRKTHVIEVIHKPGGKEENARVISSVTLLFNSNDNDVEDQENSTSTCTIQEVQ